MHVNMFIIRDNAKRIDTGVTIRTLEINENVEIFLKYHEETGTSNKKQHMLIVKLDIKKYVAGLFNFLGIYDNIKFVNLL